MYHQEDKARNALVRHRALLAACGLLAVVGTAGLYARSSDRAIEQSTEYLENETLEMTYVDADTDHELQPWGGVGSPQAFAAADTNYYWSLNFKVGASEEDSNFAICTLAGGGMGALGINHRDTNKVDFHWYGKCKMETVDPLPDNEYHRFVFYVMADGSCAATMDGYQSKMQSVSDTTPRQSTELGSSNWQMYCKYSVGDKSTTAYINDFTMHSFTGDLTIEDPCDAQLAECEAELDDSQLRLDGPITVSRGNRIGHVTTEHGNVHIEFTLTLSSATCGDEQDDGCTVFAVGDWFPIGVRQWHGTTKFAVYSYDPTPRADGTHQQFWYYYKTDDSCDHSSGSCFSVAENLADGVYEVVIVATENVLSATLNGETWVTATGLNLKVDREHEAVWAGGYFRHGVISGATVSDVFVTSI